jgi:hypothetical protein
VNHAATGEPCGDQGAECREDDACDGAGACTDNGFSGAGTLCGDSSDTECTDPDSCDGAGTCDANDAAAGVACGDPADTVCTDPDSCDGSGSCQDNHETAGVVCRDPVDDCDAAEACTGVDADCPDDLLEPAGTVCREAVGACDAEEVCDGTNEVCPADEIVDDGTPCDTDPCTLDECVAGVCETTPVANPTPPADFLFIMDASISMKRGLRTWIPEQLGALPDVLAQAGITDARFAIVRFGTNRRPDRPRRGPPVPDVVLPFTNNVAAWQLALETLQEDIRRSTEAATEAIDFALDSPDVQFRAGAIRNIILYTDEDIDAPALDAQGQPSIEKREPVSRGLACFSRRCESRWSPHQDRLDVTGARLVDERIQLNIVMRPQDRPAVDQYGDPGCTVLDANGRIDPGPTLACLLKPNARGLSQAGICDALGTCTQGKVGRSCSVDDDCNAYSLQSRLLASGVCGAVGRCTGGRVGAPCAEDVDCAILARTFKVPRARAEAESFFQNELFPGKIAEQACPAP